jgi:primary-amine oxidase
MYRVIMHRLFVCSCMAWFLFNSSLRADVIEQEFPILNPLPPGERSAWKIDWGITRHLGKGQILYIKSAMYKAPGSEYMKVIDDARLAEIYVPYNDGSTAYKDITGFSFNLMPVTLADLGPNCVAPGAILGKDKLVAKEIHDGHLLWMDTSGKTRRAETLILWSVFRAGNYCYIIKYAFRSDGTIGFRLGATAHNLRDGKDDNDTTHVHHGCWRVHIDLGGKSDTRVNTVRYVSLPGGKAETKVDPFNGGTTGGINWNSQEMTTLRFDSLFTNKHNPPSTISYDARPIVFGRPQHTGVGQAFMNKDFWITLREDDQWKYDELPGYVATPKPIKGKDIVLWHHASALHVARDEDFGDTNHNRTKGVAIVVWTGFNLSPRNVHAKTPFYP